MAKKGFQTQSRELYLLMKSRGYSEDFCQVVSRQLHSEYTATRMIGYLMQMPRVKDEDVVDEMIAILSDAKRFQQQKEMLFTQEKWNAYLNRDRSEEERE